MRERNAEKRRAKRTPKRNAAWIGLASGGTPIPCVVWDISDTGARLAAPRSNHLPGAFNLFLKRDEKSRHICRVVWRSNGYLGVKFVDGEAGELELESTLRKQARFTATTSTAKNVETASLLLPGCGPRIAARAAAAGTSGERRDLRFSSVAGGMMFMLGAATALFTLAQLLVQKPWAVEVCTRAENFCQHPEWTGVGAAIMGVVYLTTRGMEF